MSTVMSAHVPGTKVYLTCNDTCHNAKGADCDCICGGANHGCGLVGVEPVVVPMTIPNRFADHFPTDVIGSLQFHEKPMKVEREHTEAAGSSVRTEAVPGDGQPLVDVEAELARLTDAVDEDTMVVSEITGLSAEELDRLTDGVEVNDVPAE